MPSPYSPINFPLWQFLQQPVFSAETKLILNPRQFEYLYRIELLERCFAQEANSVNRNLTE
ncbi:hypothetical protein [Aliterella atlantica]|uniref:hypothetical protein n=1 Tax=Aliterella atlantica TaxID=1827278 RepID=UPI0009E60823|nr:hypothetical protein [Aliterella atlantica]